MTSAIIYTNDTSGVLEPCGCSAGGGMPGGLARRATLILSLRQQYEGVLLVDSGNFVGEQSQATVVVEAMRDMRYGLVGLGLSELLCRDAVLPAATRIGLDVINSLPDLNHIPGGVRTQAVCMLANRRIGVVAVSPAPVVLSDAELFKRLQAILRPLRSQVHVIILLSQLGLERDQGIAKWQAQEAWIDLIIGNADAGGLSEPLVFGRTQIVPTGSRGTQVGVVEIHWQKDGPAFNARRLPVDDRYEPDPGIQAKVDAYQKAQAARLQLASSQTAPTAAGTTERFREDWVAADGCGGCHKDAYSTWRGHWHAGAVGTLRRRARLIPECLTCHSEVYRRTERFLWKDGMVDGVQCSTCHGPGVIHRLLEGKGGITRAPGEDVCRSCHNKDRDPKFDYPTAREKIRHW